uniref:Dynamin-type G domain-containing protein n=2 Tax=Lotharella globosa TaxID=91324 RepID=A0A7S4DSC9_9EUKA
MNPSKPSLSSSIPPIYSGADGRRSTRGGFGMSCFGKPVWASSREWGATHVDGVSTISTAQGSEQRKHQKKRRHRKHGSVEDVMKRVEVAYKQMMRPLEAMFRYSEFEDPSQCQTHLHVKPVLSVLGPYSVGKTSCVKHFLTNPTREDGKVRSVEENSVQSFLQNYDADQQVLNIGSTPTTRKIRCFRGIETGMSYQNGTLSSHDFHPDGYGVLHGELNGDPCAGDRHAGSSEGADCGWREFGDDVASTGVTLSSKFQIANSAMDRFGTKFAAKFIETVEVPVSVSSFLANVTLIDTPGMCKSLGYEVARGEHRHHLHHPRHLDRCDHDRRYDNHKSHQIPFKDVAEWLCGESDMILLLLDVARLDVLSDEMFHILSGLTPYKDKIRVVLNKADMLSPNDLLKAHARVHWGLSQIFGGYEPVKAYVASFGKENFLKTKPTTPITNSRDEKSSHKKDEAAQNDKDDESDVGCDSDAKGSMNRRNRCSHASASSSSSSSLNNVEIVGEQVEELHNDIQHLQRESCVRRVTDLRIKAQRLQAHMAALKYLQERASPVCFCFGNKRRGRLLQDVDSLFEKACSMSRVDVRELPDKTRWAKRADLETLQQMPRVRRRHLDQIHAFLSQTLPPLLDALIVTTSFSEVQTLATQNDNATTL